MEPERLFSVASTLVLPGWLLLALAPCWKWTARFVCPVLLPSLLGALYVVLIVARWGSAEGGFGSLAEVRRLFEDPYLLLAGWVHYLAFDLFLGSWEVRDAQRHGIFLVGSSIGGMMIGRGAHAVGVPDGGPGLPFVNWSTEGGDLRPVHAVGLHSLQILPLLAWALTRIESLSEARRTTAVFDAALVLTLVTATLLVQALSGRPLLVT